jgi:tetratricopeptide (TPR) repeat protein
MAAQDIAGAEELLQRAIALAPTHAPSLSNLGMLLLEGGRDTDAAEKLLRRAVQVAPPPCPCFRLPHIGFFWLQSVLSVNAHSPSWI